jgi:hypothetical protein
MYVETDCLLALAKSDDWRREQAIAALEQYDDAQSGPLCVPRRVCRPIAHPWWTDRDTALGSCAEHS